MSSLTFALFAILPRPREPRSATTDCTVPSVGNVLASSRRPALTS